MRRTTSRMSRHVGVRCNACSREDFRGKRYKCLICYDYDLCETCYEAGFADTVHKAEHAVQCILTPNDYELYYGGEQAEQPQSFTCPMCATMGFTLAGLRDHVSSEHTETGTHVVCPVCAATPGGNQNNVTGNLAVHLAFEHLRNRDIVEDQSASGRLPIVSLAGGRGTVGSSGRGRRPQRQVPAAMSGPPLSPPNFDSMGNISDLLSQISTGARRRSMQQVSGGPATDIQQLGMSLQVARQQIRTAFQSQDQPRVRDHFPADTSAYSRPLTRFREPVAAPPKPTLVEPPAPDDPRFLLASLVEPSLGESEQQELEVERANRSMFVQELLLSTLEAQAPAGADWQRWKFKPSVDVMRGAKQAPNTGPERTAAGIPAETAVMSPKAMPTKSQEPMLTTSPETTVVESQDPTTPPSLEPTMTGNFGLTATASVQPTIPRYSGPTERSSPGPTSTSSSGHTGAERPAPIGDSSGHTEATSGGSTAPSSPGATVASSIGPIAATPLEPTAAQCLDSTLSTSPDAAPACTD